MHRLVPCFSTHSQVIEGQNTKRAITQRVIALSKRLVGWGKLILLLNGMNLMDLFGFDFSIGYQDGY
ncbi:hypothetical protein OC513_05055 [Vibrio vulnificus]|nr:hypothetical protein [Vibrio vulnificus]